MILFLDCAAGLSGDMLLAGFLDMGLPLGRLRQVLDQLGLGKIRIRVERVRRDGVKAVRISVSGGSRYSPQPAQRLIRFVKESRLDSSMKRSIGQVLEALARAEGAAHGLPWRNAIFHQLARPDTLVDLAGFCAGLRHFRIDAVHTSAVPIGCCYQDPHGVWRRRPGPAVQRLLSRFPMVRLDEPFEWATPTGAALLASFASAAPSPPFQIFRIGHGIGHRSSAQGPATLRLLLGRPI